MTDLSWQHKEIDNAPYDVTLLHINPDHALQAITELPSSHVDGHSSIGYWAWELPEIPADWEKTFKHFDEIWVPSNFVQDAVAMKSPVPVVRIPHAIEVKLDTALTRASFGLPEEPFLFLVMFDTYSRQERKNPYGAIEAFRNAFAADDMSVRLVVKVNNAIMGSNWFHLQDGTGTAKDGTNDLTVTTSASVRVGDIVTVSFQIPRDQLDLASQIVGELASTLQSASDQAASGGTG